MLLSREQILQAADRKTEDVAVPEWGGTVRIMAMSGTDRDAYESHLVQVKADGSRVVSTENARARLVSLTLVDENGDRVFSDADIIELGKKFGRGARAGVRQGPRTIGPDRCRRRGADRGFRRRPERRFYFRLAAHLGCTVEELLARTSSPELSEWMAYEKEYGLLGPERGDYQAALVAQVVAAVNSGKGARPKLTDFLLRWAPRKRQSGREQLAIFRALASKAAASPKKD